MRNLPLLAVLTGLAAASCAAEPAFAAGPPCGPMADMREQLAKKFSEAPIGRGITMDGRMVELYTTADGSTWTLIITTPDGKSCVTGAGKSWIPLAPAPQGEEIS